MILDVVELVRQLSPTVLAATAPSVACVCTTQSKFLVFDRNADRPACVVEIGERDRLMRLESVLQQLHPALPGIVPRSLACAPWRDGRYVHIQEGLAGVPWFRVADTCRSADDWRHLLRRAVGMMFRLHSAVASVPAWNSRVNVPAELRRQLETFERDGAIDVRLRGAVLRAGEIFDRAGTIPAVWQHGDFSLNNLLVSATSVSVIDFDEFGSTLVPLHDAFGLAISMHLSQHGRFPLSYEESVDIAVGPSVSNGLILREQLPSLLLHHLLKRVNACADSPRRANLRTALLGLLETLLESPETFFAAGAGTVPRAV